jgi:hypothetical protein
MGIQLLRQPNGHTATVFIAGVSANLPFFPRGFPFFILSAVNYIEVITLKILKLLV